MKNTFVISAFPACGATEVMRRNCEKQYFEHMKDTFDWCDR